MLTLETGPYSRGLDGDAAVLLVLPGVSGTSLASLRGGDDAGLGGEEVEETRQWPS